jgi:cell division protein FtsW
VTGVQLPLISAGGTSLVLTLLIVGLLIRFARCEPEAIEHQRGRDRSRLARLLLPVPAQAVDPVRPRRRRPEPAAERPAPRPEISGGRTVVRVAASRPGEGPARERAPGPRDRRTPDGRPRVGEARRQPPPRARSTAPESPRRPR